MPKGLVTVHSNNSCFFLPHQARRGIRGVILDKEKTFMNQATITIEGSQHVYPADQGGRFWIYLAPGKYQVSIHCPGFKTLQQVSFQKIITFCEYHRLIYNFYIITLRFYYKLTRYRGYLTFLMYCKNSKIWDTSNNCHNCPKNRNV